METHEEKKNGTEGLTDVDKRMQNLRHWNELPPDELKEFKRKGQAAAVKAREENRRFRQAFEFAADLPATPKDGELVEALLEEMPGLTKAQAMGITMTIKAIGGSVEAARLCIEMLGEKPSDKLDIGNNGEAFDVNIRVVD